MLCVVLLTVLLVMKSAFLSQESLAPSVSPIGSTLITKQFHYTQGHFPLSKHSYDCIIKRCNNTTIC